MASKPANQFYLDRLKPLVGGTVVGLATDKDGEFYGIQVKGKDGKTRIMWILCDDEGNGPGSFEIVEVDNG